MLAAEQEVDPAQEPSPEAVEAAAAPLGGGEACILQGGGGETPNNLVGYGIVDAYAAVQRALALAR
jgi:hypothetical protein